MEDVKLPTHIQEAFDFGTSAIHSWEIDQILKALDEEKLSFEAGSYAYRRAFQRKIRVRDVYGCIKRKNAKTKDSPPWNPEDKSERKAGINFKCKDRNGREVHVKVGWSHKGYTIITVY